MKTSFSLLQKVRLLNNNSLVIGGRGEKNTNGGLVQSGRRCFTPLSRVTAVSLTVSDDEMQ